MNSSPITIHSKTWEIKCFHSVLRLTVWYLKICTPLWVILCSNNLSDRSGRYALMRIIRDFPVSVIGYLKCNCVIFTERSSKEQTHWRNWKSKKRTTNDHWKNARSQTVELLTWMSCIKYKTLRYLLDFDVFF